MDGLLEEVALRMNLMEIPREVTAPASKDTSRVDQRAPLHLRIEPTPVLRIPHPDPVIANGLEVRVAIHNTSKAQRMVEF